jgi:hypothetical protein
MQCWLTKPPNAELKCNVTVDGSNQEEDSTPFGFS